MDFIRGVLSDILGSVSNIKKLFTSESWRSSERDERHSSRYQALEPSMNTIKVLIEKPEIPRSHLKESVEQLDRSLKEQRTKDYEMKTRQAKERIEEEIAAGKAIAEIEKQTEKAKEELKVVEEKLKDSDNKLKLSLERERTTNMRVEVQIQQMEELERKKQAMQNGYEYEKAKLRTEMEALRKEYARVKKDEEMLGMRLLAIQTAAETLINKCPQEPSPSIFKAMSSVDIDDQTLKSLEKSMKTFESQIGEDSSVVIPAFKDALPKDPESERYVEKILGKIAVEDKNRQHNLENLPKSFRIRQEALDKESEAMAASERRLKEKYGAQPAT